MKSATVHQLKQELQDLDHTELLQICLRLSKFKKENKELLTYLLFETSDENNYILEVNKHITDQFNDITQTNYYYVKKSVRKILRYAKKYIRYSQKKETEVEILMHFCKEMKFLQPPMAKNEVLKGIFERQLKTIHKTVNTLHEDLQYDYFKELLDLE